MDTQNQPVNPGMNNPVNSGAMPVNNVPSGTVNMMNTTPNIPVGNNSAPNGAAKPMVSSEPKKIGPVVAILVIVLVLIVAALYLFASKIGNTSPADYSAYPAGNASDTAPAETVQPVTNNSNDINSIRSDLDVSTQGVDGQTF